MTTNGRRSRSVLDLDRPLKGKAVLITGAGRGIGEAYARLCSALGARLFLVDRVPETVSAVCSGIAAGGGQSAWARCDVSDPADASAAVDACVSVYGRIDGLVNNAATYAIGSVAELDDETCRRMVEVNVLGSIYCAHAAIRAMRASGTGSIVNITSGAQAGIPDVSVYGATKGAIASFTYGAALDLAGTGIRVNAMSPLAETRMTKDGRRFRERRGGQYLPAVLPTLSDNAAAVAYLLSDFARGVTGQVVRVDVEGLSLMGHPALLPDTVHRGSAWTFASVRAAFDTALAAKQVPVGVAAHPRQDRATLSTPPTWDAMHGPCAERP
jgi:NAD(P)-dependent dehydrogenase (short-subunit alcohol dehydrogenase family)